MSGKSFYDLDYIIEINEQRYEQYMSAYNELMGKLTNIVLIYSGVAIFLVPIVRNVFWWEKTNWVLGLSFGVFVVLFGISIFNTVSFIIPVTMASLEMPQKYYGRYRKECEKSFDDRLVLDDLLKSSYIHELEKILIVNDQIFVRKRNFYRNGIIYALLALLPYLVCFWFNISIEQKKSGNNIQVTL